MAFIYILKLNDNSYYVGSWRKLVQRIAQHRSGYVASTKYRLPCKVVYVREVETYPLAKKEEFRIKS